ncbi:histidine phosphatase family protein [Thalassorhabdomicrobium marinisediminis]|uniref:histidine phosphatase family protein n=1 Tax=Thalassorhabdomicrobium marinisediminis TaxID=2170577 RepID=UPI0024937476|nr:histidine phosphatase family protein [Thalassorhabdomicrobium marinisediminis]
MKPHSAPHHVFLLRHGETEWNREGRIQGQLNSDLTPEGQEQARHQGRVLQRLRQDLGAHHVRCSPLGRVRDTARLAGEGADIVTDARLMEIGCGTWEGTRHQDRLATDPDIVRALKADFDVYIKAPGGEGLDALSDRIAAFLDDLDGPTIIFAHKIALVVMRAILCGSDLSSDMAPAQGSVLEIRNGVARSHV